jgi:hypothetical protein
MPAQSASAPGMRPGGSAPPPAPLSLASSYPASASYSVSQPGPQGSRSEAAPEGGESSAIATTAYLVQLATLARELEAQATGRGDAATIRLLRQRLTEWVEDVRSVGGNHELASAVEELVKRLSAALAAPANLVAEATAIAGALAALAAGTPPPLAKKKSRLAFWK